MMRAAIPAAMLLLSLGACGPTEADKAREDAAAVAAVNAAQNRLPPVVPLRPEPLEPADFARMDDTGSSCAFYPDPVTPDTRAVAVARPSYAWFKADAALTRLVSDSGSAAGPLGVYTHYTGREASLRIVPASAESTGAAEPLQERAARLRLTDTWDRAVYDAAGILRCASQ